MPEEIKTYKCKFCKEIYDEIDDATICEGIHFAAIELIDSSHKKGDLYPRCVQVKFSDGSQGWYYVGK